MGIVWKKNVLLIFASDIFFKIFPLSYFVVLAGDCTVGHGAETHEIYVYVVLFSLNSSIQYSLDAVVTEGCILGCAHVLVCRLPG